MGAARQLIAWIAITVLVIVLPPVLASSLPMGYPLLVLASLIHTLALGIAVNLHQRAAFYVGLGISVLNVIALVWFNDTSIVHALMMHHR